MDAGGSDKEEDCPWSEHISSSKKPYFFNRKTNVSQWHMPPELALFRQRREQRRLAAAAAASGDRSSSAPSHGNVQDVTPPSTPLSSSSNATSLNLRTAHNTPNTVHGGHAGTPKPIASLQVGGHHTPASSASVQLTPSTPATKSMFMPQYALQDGHMVASPSVLSAMPVNSVELAQPALHPLQQATLLQKQFSEASRGSLTPGTPSPSVSGQVQLLRQPQQQQQQQQTPTLQQQPLATASAGHAASTWTSPRLEARSVLASAPSILYSQPSVRYQQHPPQGAAFADYYTRSAISHLQGWSSEGLERQSLQCKKEYENALYHHHPRLAQQLHHSRSINRALSLSSKVSEAQLRALARERQELEEQLGMNSNS